MAATTSPINTTSWDADKFLEDNEELMKTYMRKCKENGDFYSLVNFAIEMEMTDIDNIKELYGKLKEKVKTTEKDEVISRMEQVLNHRKATSRLLRHFQVASCSRNLAVHGYE